MFLKRLIVFFVALAVFFSVCCVAAFAADEEDLTVSKGCHSLDGTQSLLGSEKKTENAGSVFMYETQSQTVLYQWESDKPVYPASLVKIMSALLVLEKGNLTDTVIVTQSALDTVSYDAISVDLQAGEKISVEDLMYCLLVYSANDAAAVLAEYIAGSQAAFTAMMNDRAAELGCTGTVFTNPHGLHEDEQVTTARDLAKILNAALEHEAFRTFFGTIHYQVPATNLHQERRLSSNNYLMNTDAVGIYFDSRVTGGRTGITTEGYRNIASLSQSGNMEVICIVMDAASTLSDSGRTEVYGGFPETIALLDQAYTGYARRQIIFPNQTLQQYAVSGGDNDLFITSYEGFSTVLPSDMTVDKLTFIYQETDFQAPIAKGQNIATLQVWHGDLCIAQTEVYAMNDVAVSYEKTAELRPVKQDVSWLTVLLIVIALAAAGSVAYVFIARFRSKKAAAAQMRRRRR